MPSFWSWVSRVLRSTVLGSPGAAPPCAGRGTRPVYNPCIPPAQAGNPMCGIVGFLDKRPWTGRPLGHTLLGLLEALSCRGPDSAGVALFERLGGCSWVVQLKVPEGLTPAEAARAVPGALGGSAAVLGCEPRGA